MIQRLFSLSVCLLLLSLCAGPSAVAQNSRSKRMTTAPQPVEHFKGDLAQFFGADTMFYLEVADLAAAADEMGGSDVVFGAFEHVLDETLPPKAKRPVVSVEQFKSMMGSTLAMGVRSPNVGGKSIASNSEVEIVGILRAPTAETARAIVGLVDDLNKATSAKPPAGVKKTVKGVAVTTYSGSTPATAFAWAQMGDTVVFGSSTGVNRTVQAAGRPTGATFADNPGYRSALARAGNHNVFAYLNGAPLVKAFHEGMESSITNSDPKRARQEAATIKALRAFFGMDALRGGSLSALVDNGKVTIRGALEIDRSISGLVSVLLSPPGITMRSATLMPEGVDAFGAMSLDFVGLFDLVMSVIPPEAVKDLGFNSSQDAVQKTEEQLGAKLRDEFLASLGPELSIALLIPDKPGEMTVSDETPNPKPSPEFIGYVEIKDTELIKRIMSNIFYDSANQSAPIPVEYRDVDIWSRGPFAWSFVNGFMVIGESDQVRMAIDASIDNRSLVTNAYYNSAAGAIPTDTIYGGYLGPKVFEEAAREAMGKNQDGLPLDFIRNGVFVSTQKDSGGVSTTVEFPVPNLRLLLAPDRKVQARAVY